jgi:hypothetical protein
VFTPLRQISTSTCNTVRKAVMLNWARNNNAAQSSPPVVPDFVSSYQYTV